VGAAVVAAPEPLAAAPGGALGSASIGSTIGARCSAASGAATAAVPLATGASFPAEGPDGISSTTAIDPTSAAPKITAYSGHPMRREPVRGAVSGLAGTVGCGANGAGCPDEDGSTAAAA